MGTIRLGSFVDGAIEFFAEYNDGNKRVKNVSCVNNSGGNGRITVIEPSDKSIVAQVTFLGGTTSYNISGNSVTVNADGSVDIPYEIRLDHPVP
ncbi:MAG: hypothetical protein LC687_07850 [Actinobacteria bacterium]|nr:hypothetical protein [Actinomycetota bacterium]